VLSALRNHPHADVSHQGVCDLLRARTAATPMRRFQPTGYEEWLGTTITASSARSGYSACRTAADDPSCEIDEAEVIYGPSGG
jgi:hypothetical protein